LADILSGPAEPEWWLTPTQEIDMNIIRNLSLGAIIGAVLTCASGLIPTYDARAQATPPANAHVAIDRSGRKQTGKASFYAARYSGRTMADGTPMRLYGNNAASLTLPLGSTAKVTNLETGRSAIITIRDRGPYVKGRIVDLSPMTATKIGLDRREGIAKVEIMPLSVPQLDGTVWTAPNASPGSPSG
jgi:rare lipoprotein A